MGVAILELYNNNDYFNTLWVVMMLYGSVASLYYVINAMDMLLDLFVRDPVPLERFGAGKGFWAVVTGCTDGIGKEMALQLADKGFNIIMLSRTSSKLEKMQQSIEVKGVRAISYAVDFANCSEQQWEEIRQIVSKEKVSVLINNVGLCHKNPIFFDEESESLCNDMVEVNINTMMSITRIVVPQMQKRKNGLIINMGSFAALRSLPFLSVYAGTKGFVKTYTQSLAYELEPDNIMVSHIFSFWVTSKMSGYREPTLSVPSPEQYVRCVFDRLGLRCGAFDSHTTIPYYPHSLLSYIVSCLWDPMHAKGVHYKRLRKRKA
ncbi:hypothetical protein LPJ64_003106 [Coemansia asiatica]|uniref:Uncharacterized protein n=1 Tax=Coemansia asiatica TaxID=1052880 RepID=A0A9W7XIG6_9FUNG|nr:hypothetical protein LPJ64_003106 [Coemansia asiatica]